MRFPTQYLSLFLKHANTFILVTESHSPLTVSVNLMDETQWEN